MAREFTLTMKVTDRFFDRPAVLKRADRAKVNVLRRQSGLIAKIAKRSIRRRKKSSKPGQPPSAHAKQTPNLKTILYALEDGGQSAVVGPLGFNQKADVPHKLEFGGNVDIISAGGRRTRKKLRTVTIQPRPFMAPAEATARDKYAPLFAGQITRRAA